MTYNERERALHEAKSHKQNIVRVENLSRVLDQAKISHDVLVNLECECSTLDCGQTIVIILDDYHRMTRKENAFVVIPSHLDPDIETATMDGGDYLIIAKRADLWQFLQQS